MVKRLQITLVDDIDGSRASETIAFSLDGVDYEIDLSDRNATTMREQFAAWVRAGRRVGGRRRASSRTKNHDDLDKIRLWARGNGFIVSDRGPIAKNVLEAYDNAH